MGLVRASVSTSARSYWLRASNRRLPVGWFGSSDRSCIVGPFVRDAQRGSRTESLRSDPGLRGASVVSLMVLRPDRTATASRGHQDFTLDEVDVLQGLIDLRHPQYGRYASVRPVDDDAS